MKENKVAAFALTSASFGEVFRAVGVVTLPALRVDFLSRLEDASGSLLGEVLIFSGEIIITLLSRLTVASAFSSSSSFFFFIMASLELALIGAEGF